MKNPVNLTLLAIKVAMYNKLDKSIEKDKALLKACGKLEYKTQYINIKIINKTKETLIKDKVQELADKYDIDINTLTKTTLYKQCNITTTTKADKQAERAYNLLKEVATKDIAKTANSLTDTIE